MNNKIKIYPGFPGNQEVCSDQLQSVDIFRRTDLFRQLGVPRNASKAAIIKKYRELSLSGAHPDKGGSREEWDKIKGAYDILISYDKTIHKNKLEEWWWNAEVNEVDNAGTYAKELNNLLGSKQLRMGGTSFQFLTSDLKDWETVLTSASSRTKTIAEFNSYVSRLLEILSTSYVVNGKAGDEKVTSYYTVRRIVGSLEGLQSKNQIKAKEKELVSEIEKRADNDAGVKTKFKSRRNGKRRLQKLPGWDELSEGERTNFLSKMEGSEVKDDNDATEVISEVKRRIQKIRGDAPKKAKIAQMRNDCANKLWKLRDWNKLLEPEEKTYLLQKVDSITDDDENLSKNVLNYAQKFLIAAWYRKYQSQFWKELETKTNLGKTDIYKTRTVEEGGGKVKIGEKYNEATTFMAGVEPVPKSIDGENFLKFKLFFYEFSQEGWNNIAVLNAKIASVYGVPTDSGWTPKSGGPSGPPPPGTGKTPPSETLDQVREKSIQEIEDYINILKGQNYWGTLDDSDEWYQWKTRYKRASEKNQIADLKKADLNWLYRFSAKKAIMKSLATNGLSVEILRIRDDNLNEHLKSFDGQSLIETEKNRLLDLINNYGNNKDREIDEAIKAVEAVLREKGLESKASQILGSKWKEDFQGLLSDSEIEEKKANLIARINAFVEDEVREADEAIAIIKQKLQKLGLSDSFLGNWRNNFQGKNKEEIEVEKNKLLKLIDQEINRKEEKGEISSEEANQKREDLVSEVKNDVEKKVRDELKKGHSKLNLEEKDLPPQLFAPFKSLSEKLKSLKKTEEITTWEENLLTEIKKGKEVKLTNIKNEAIQEIEKELNAGNYELGRNQNFKEVIRGMVNPDDIEKKKLSILKLIKEQKSTQTGGENTNNNKKPAPTPSVWPQRIWIGALIIGVPLIVFVITRILKNLNRKKR